MNKKLTLTLLISLIMCAFTSCAPKITYFENVRLVDFSKYTEQGIFLTESNSVSFDYEPVGSINVMILSGYEKKIKSSKTVENDIYGDELYEIRKTAQGDFIFATPQAAIAKAVEQLEAMNANGIINLNIRYIHSTYQPGYELTGMAIRR